VTRRHDTFIRCRDLNLPWRRVVTRRHTAKSPGTADRRSSSSRSTSLPRAPVCLAQQAHHFVDDARPHTARCQFQRRTSQGASASVNVIRIRSSFAVRPAAARKLRLQSTSPCGLPPYVLRLHWTSSLRRAHPLPWTVTSTLRPFQEDAFQTFSSVRCSARR